MAGGVWNRLGSLNQAAVASGNLVFSDPTASLGLVAGDLVVACIAYRGNAAFTLPAGWSLVATQQSSGNTSTTTSTSIASGVMAYIVWPGSAPDLTFVRTGGDVALGTLRAYRGQAASSPYDTGSANTLASNSLVATAPSLTTAEDGELLIIMRAGADNDNFGAFSSVTDPSTASTIGDFVHDPVEGEWRARTWANTTTGADTDLQIADAIKGTAGATGELRHTSPSANSRHVLIAAAFKSEPINKAEISKVSRNVILTPPNDSAIISRVSRNVVVGPPTDGPSVSKFSRDTILTPPKDKALVSKFSRYAILKPSTFVAPKHRAQNVNYR